VRIDPLVRRAPAQLAELSRDLWKKHLARLPRSNPVERFQQRFEQDLPWLQERGLAFYHAWAFATVRQLGSAFELAALNLRWLQSLGTLQLDGPITAFEAISAANKTLIMKGARAVNSRRSLDVRDMFATMAADWRRGTASLADVLG
jgi:hypothetical protein